MTASKRTTAAGAAAVVVLIGAAAFAIGRYGGFAPSLPGSAATSSASAGGDAAGRGRNAAAGEADKLPWRALTPAQQAALQPLQAEWAGMDGVRKAKWLELAKRFNAMKPEEQQRVHERMRVWIKLTPEQRELARETYMRARKIAPEQKNATWKSYQELPEEQKRKLAGRKPAADADKAAAAPKVPASCPAGMVRNALSATPPCVAAPAPVPPPPPPVQPVTPPAPPPPPPPQEKPVPANWGITPNNA